MTLIELLLAIAVLSGVMGVLVTVSESLRSDNAERRTRATLAVLRAALVAYHETHHAWPAVSGSDSDSVTADALRTLARDPKIGQSLARTAGVNLDPPHVAAYDGYGYAIVYLPRSHATGGPDFVCVGPDGLLGDPASSDIGQRRAAADNLYGADLEELRP